MAATQGFTSSVYPLSAFGLTIPGYAALYSVVLNFVVSIGFSPIFDRLSPPSKLASANRTG
jgi:SSS family solute:Na+ symporter